MKKIEHEGGKGARGRGRKGKRQNRFCKMALWTKIVKFETHLRHLVLRNDHFGQITDSGAAPRAFQPSPQIG